MTGFDAVDVITTKRDRKALSDGQIDWVIAAYTRGEVADEQMSALHAGGGGRLVAVVCVDQHGNTLMACGRCRQLLWENGGPDLLVETVSGIKPMTEVLPDAFGPDDLISRA